MSSKDITLLSTADWDNPFWTNKQHVALELARTGNRVLYIESLGLRRPTVSRQDVLRIARRLMRALRPPKKVHERLWVWSPILLPFRKSGISGKLNRLMLHAALMFWTRVLGMRREILWTYNPLTAEYVHSSQFGLLVYHCVDEIKAQPGMPYKEIESAERRLVQCADLCFVTAEGLLASRLQINSNTFYFPNVADFEHFSTARDEATIVPIDIACLPAPRIGFVGALSGYKQNFELLRFISHAHPEWSVVLIGKIGEGDPWTDVSLLQDVPNIHIMGARSYESLPRYLKGFDVAILPSLINEYTHGMFPMKFFEYLAAGRPVVSTNLPALRAYSGVAYLAVDDMDFVLGIEKCLAQRGAGVESRVAAAREQTYERRTRAMMELINKALS